MVAAKFRCVADRRRRSADHSRLGGCASTPADRTGWSMGSHRYAPSAADHREAHKTRRLLPAAGRRQRRALADARTWPVALGDVRHTRSTRPGTERWSSSPGRRLRQDGRGRVQPELAVEAFKKTGSSPGVPYMSISEANAAWIRRLAPFVGIGPASCCHRLAGSPS